MSSSTLTLAAVAALAATAPTASAHHHGTTPALVAPSFVSPSRAGHASLAGQHRAHRRAARHRHAKSATGKPGGSTPPVLRRIAECESHGNPRSVGGGGTYRGAYQFSEQTWRAVGGRGDPAAAPMAEQTRRAARLLARSGPSQWPVCGG
jgi:hypothetical protein